MVIGLIGALDEEIALFLKELEVQDVQVHAGIEFYKGRLAGQQVVVCKSGVGKVNAALTTQILIDLFQVETIIFSGVAGTLRSEINVGDIVISTNTQQYDVDFTAIGFPPGVIPSLTTSIFVADPKLVQLAEKAAINIKGKVFKGKILSGDRFVASKELVNRLLKNFGGLCVEAEGAALGQVCFLNDIPFVIIRGMSDQADRAAPADFAKFVKIAAHRGSVLVLAMLERLTDDE